MKKSNLFRFGGVLLLATLLAGCNSNKTDVEDFFGNKGPFANNGGGNNNGANKSSSAVGNNNNGGANTGNSNGANTNNSNNNNQTQYTDQDKFTYNMYQMPDGECAISAIYDECTDTNVFVPPTYTRYDGVIFQITATYQSGFSGIPAETVTLPEGFKNIDVGGFSTCLNLTTVYLPSTLRSMNLYGVFMGSPSIKKIVYNGNKAEWNAITLDDHWNYNAPAITIECKDGNIEIPKWGE